MALFFLAGSAPISLASMILGQSDWDSGAEPWTEETGYDYATIDTDGTPAWLLVTFPANPGSPPEDLEIVQTAATTLFAGSWAQNPAGDFWVEFDFMAEDVVPDEVAVYWSGNGNMWGYTVFDANTDTMTLDSWVHFETIGLSSNVYGLWSLSPFVNEDDFLADLQSIDWIGVYIDRGDTVVENYRIDNFQLWVPEPAELAFLGFAVVSTAASLRRRRKVDAHAFGPTSKSRPGMDFG
jgi:hypothetical protein